MMGGRTNHGERIFLRNSFSDFKPSLRDGLGFDWLTPSDDPEPHSTKAQKFIGVYGTNTGLESTPDSPAGVLQQKGEHEEE